MDDRAEYIESLKRERAGIAARPDSPAKKQRLAHLDDVLDSYDEKPVHRRVEKAVPKK